jgi:hypothetical protein
MEKQYSIYDPETFVILYVVFAEEAPENSTELMVTEHMAKPVYSPEENKIINMATPDEQAAFENEILNTEYYENNDL